MTKQVFLDVECYPNYFLICFKSIKQTKFYQLSDNSGTLEIEEISKIMQTYRTIGFNSNKYDLWMITYALKGANNSELKSLSDKLISPKKTDTSSTPRKHAWEIGEEYNIKFPLSWQHIDIIGPAPAIGVGLKMYGARMHTKILQDLPYDPTCCVKESDFALIRKYCLNDVIITMELYDQIKEAIDLRVSMGKIYNLNLTSKSNAQVAESILKQGLGIKVYTQINNYDEVYKYNPPSFIKFQTPDILEFVNEIQTNEFKCNAAGKLVKNAHTRKKLKIADTDFSVGIGGLHSNEKHRATIIKEDEFLIDIDVTSYYPTIILNNEYYPEIAGKEFLTLYKKIYEARIEAKKNKDKIKSETYKIILNGSFGKFGSKYSFLYSPSLLLHTTLTGQLSLLMLIEEVILGDFKVISANTDGIIIVGNKTRFEDLKIILRKWEEITKFNLEITHYKAIYHESVNSYIAILANNSVKAKGNYATDGLTKNPVAVVCKDAIVRFLQYQIPIDQTLLENLHDIKKFLITRKVEGGAVYKDQYLGKIVRWYYGINGDKIIYKKNGNKVATSDGAIPLMIINQVSPKDIDLSKYHAKVCEMLKNLGIERL